MASRKPPRRIHSAPWATRLPDGDLVEYGPAPSTYARRDAEHRQWAWKPANDEQASRRAMSEEAYLLRSWMRPDGRHLRADVPARQLEVYVHIYEHGRSERWTARKMAVTRTTVRGYMKRLVARMGGSDE